MGLCKRSIREETRTMIVEDFMMIIPKDMQWKDHVFLLSEERKHEHVHAWINNLDRKHSLIMSKCYIFKDGKPTIYTCFAATTTVSTDGIRRREGIIPYLLNEVYDALDCFKTFCSRRATFFRFIQHEIDILEECFAYFRLKAYASFDDARKDGKRFNDHESLVLSKFEKKHREEYKVMDFTTENKQQGYYGIKIQCIDKKANEK